METAEAVQRIQCLERRYFELNKDLRAVRAQVIEQARNSESRAQLEARLTLNEREMHDILQEVTRIEDSLLE